MEIQRAIDLTSRFGHLQTSEAEAVMNQIMAGETTQAQIGAYLMALRMKGETQEEIEGSARAMRANAVPIPARTDPALMLDTAGTGGDRAGTFNISTTVAFVAAGAGIPVAKHGNRAASSRCGSADVLKELGLNLDLTPEQVGQALDEVGIGFLFAPALHPAMRHTIGPRRELGVRTIFNMLGPLTNPAGAQRQLMGVFASDLAPFMATVLRGLGTLSAMVVHGYGGLDELTTTGPNVVSHLRDGEIRTYELDPETLGFRGANIHELLGGEPPANASIMRGVLSGDIDDAKRDVVILNAAAAIIAAGRADTWEEGMRIAEESINSGAALDKLNRLLAFSQRVAQ
ncbi:MAG: anthranilate phosphoribosyltransferase [Anaerolineae bacterium]|nr:anthranilate phosphoribosyltransferase [Anaerolineae bacterium]